MEVPTPAELANIAVVVLQKKIGKLEKRIEILEKRKPPQIPMHTRVIG